MNFVLHDLHSGATLNEIIGAYDQTPKTEMITIVDKHEYKRLMDYIRKVDPKAFVTVYSVSDMRYQPKKSYTRRDPMGSRRIYITQLLTSVNTCVILWLQM